MTKATNLEIGGIVLAVLADQPICDFLLGETYARFQTDKPADVVLHAHCDGLPESYTDAEKVFLSGGNWSLYHLPEAWIFKIHDSGKEDEPHQIAIISPDFQTGDIFIEPYGDNPFPILFPLGYPFGEALMIHLLSRGLGVMLHACGVTINEQGTLFVGVSGAGKSTLATLWKNHRDVELLSDDRVIVRRHGGRYWAYGTPWHGDARVASPAAVPLERIFIIKHAPENRVVDLKAADAVSQLLVRSFSTFWDSVGMAFTLEFLEQLGQQVPCHTLGFVPDLSVLDFVECMI